MDADRESMEESDNQSDKEEEGLFPLESSDESGSEVHVSESDLESDLEEKNDDDEIDVSAWGKNRRMYYSTDYVDKDFGGYEGSDAELADEEEREALELQKKLTAQLDDDDFGMDLFNKAEVPPEENLEKINLNQVNLSLNEKIALLKSESPELMVLIEDIKEKFEEMKEVLRGENNSNNKIKFQILSRYCVNGLFYLAMKAKRQEMTNHPVRKRIVNYQLLSEQLTVDDSFDDIAIKPEIKKIPKRQRPQVDDYDDDDDSNDGGKMVKFADHDEVMDEKRGINYQISKNKGLVPHRKKEYKNPRVKHRLKYRKAKIRRRGQVREPKTEVSRYGGEISGIKIGVRKGVKLK